MRNALALLTTAAALAACRSSDHTADTTTTTPAASVATAGTPASVAHAAWTRNATIYEVNVRQYTPQGTFAAFQKHLPRLKAMGVDMLWFMPVQPIGVKNRKGSLGSYYSISDYRAVNPEYGSAADFKAMAAAAHAQGMKVILDWVPNHTAFDHKWVTEHPDWYTHKADGTISNAKDNEGHDTDWTDVAELNYDNKDMRAAMVGDMRFWLDSMGVDGLRCDVAGGVPDDFWADARASLGNGHPDLFMLAEAEAPKFHKTFDMTYGWELHHLLNEVAKGKQPTSVLDTYLAKQSSTYPADAYHMDFTSDHDENSWNGSEFERMGANHLAAFVLAGTLQGSMPLVYTGQEVSMKKRLRFFDKDTVDWKGASLAPFYTAMFALKHAEQAIANGDAGGPQVALATNAGDRVYAYSRTRDSNTVVVAVNFADTAVAATYASFDKSGDYTDWFSKAKVPLGAAGKIDIPAHGYRVLVH